jgi:GT2 family glycosyltransferase
VQCLESILSMDYPAHSLILVDNGSDDDSASGIRDWVDGRPRLRERFTLVETGENLGFAGGCNVGIRLALEGGADYVLLLNNDTVVDAGFLTELVREAGSDPSTGLVGPKILYFDDPHRIWAAGGKIDWWLGRSRHLHRNEIDRGQADRAVQVDYLPGCAILAKRRLIEKVGMLDESLFFYWEDADWCMRAREQGWRIRYAPSSRIWHKVKATSSHYGEISSYNFARNRIVFMKRYASPMQRLCFYPFQVGIKGLGAVLVIGLLRGDKAAARAYLKGILAGLRYSESGPASR